MITASNLTRGRMTRRSFQSRMIGPIVRCPSNQPCSLSEPLEKQNAASSRKGVVGSNGRNSPRKASPTQEQPATLYKNLRIDSVTLSAPGLTGVNAEIRDEIR